MSNTTKKTIQKLSNNYSGRNYPKTLLNKATVWWNDCNSKRGTISERAFWQTAFQNKKILDIESNQIYLKEGGRGEDLPLQNILSSSGTMTTKEKLLLFSMSFIPLILSFCTSVPNALLIQSPRQKLSHSCWTTSVLWPETSTHCICVQC